MQKLTRRLAMTAPALALRVFGTGVPVALALAYPAAAGETGKAAEPLPFYTVAVYDGKRDPNQDLKDTVARATAEDKRVLLFVGGDWCGWCKVFERFVRANESVSTAITDGFVVMKVDYAPRGRNGKFLSRYPKAPGYPHFYVLAKDGALLHSQGTSELEEGSSYNLEAVLSFLEGWTSGASEGPPVDEAAG